MSKFSDISRAIETNLKMKLATVDRDAEWQRVNTYIADCLKDGHVLYSKLARLQSDLEKISESVLDVGSSLSEFSRTFFEGRSSMTLPDVFGSDDEKPIFGGTPDGPVFGESPEAAPPTPDFEIPEPSPEAEAEPIDMEFDYQDEEPQE